MRIIDGKDFSFRDTCVTIGKFDGVHIGHRRILDKVTELSRKKKLLSTVFTFDFEYFKTKDEIRLNSRAEKIDLLEKAGIDLLIDYPFDVETKNMLPEEFVLNILLEKLGCRALVVGENFRFGKGAVGDTSTLNELGNKYGFEVYACSMVEYEGTQVSSSRIREELARGNTGAANRMLRDKA